MATKIFVHILFFSSLCLSFDCHKILVTSVGLAASQNLIMGRVADVLGEAGNDVTLLRWILFPETKSVQLHHAKEISYKMLEDKEVIDFIRSGTQSMAWEKLFLHLPPFGVLKRLLHGITNGCDLLLQDKKMIAKLKAEKYDVIIIHMADFCTFGLTEVLGVKAYTWFSTAFMMDHMARYSGTPAPPSFVPSVTSVVTDQMSFGERTKNLLVTVFLNGMIGCILLPRYTNLFREHYGPDFPSMDHIVRESQLVFINSDPFFEYARPTQHNVIYVGGLTMEKSKPLNEEWQQIVNNAQPGGLVLFSLGTVANTTGMPLEYKQRFMNVFKRFPDYTFIYRLEGQLPDATGATNVIFPKWIPQKDLLGDHRVKCFITHGGYNSLTEATFLGVSMVVMPLFGDQPPNAKRVERKNIGRILDKDDLTEENIYKALNEVLTSKEIQSNAGRLAEMIQKKPVSAVDLLVGWVHFLAQFKNLDSLKPVSRNMGLIQYYMIDVLVFLLAFMSISFWLIYKTLRLCCRKLHGGSDKKSKKD